MLEASDQLARRRLILLSIILATIPCYCLGVLAVMLAPDTSPTASPSPTFASTATDAFPPPTSTLSIVTGTMTDTPTITASPTDTQTPTYTPSVTSTETVLASPTDTPSVTPSFTPSHTFTPSFTPTRTSTPSRTPSPTNTPTVTITPFPVTP
ncbi:MAG: hypothetical protein R3307_01180 [Anaerolineales bacterium]|nr:hypothetical protein [Anaerolineales bacterium]